MAFQFLCPGGHLLQGEESSAGSHCQCPHCGILFIIPQPLGRPSPSSGAPPEPPPEEGQDQPIEPIWERDSAGGTADAETQLGFVVPEDDKVEVPVQEEAVHVAELAGAADESENAILEVVCPKGHRLQAPRKTLGKDVLCTVCNRRFRLGHEHTVEYLEQRAQERALREQRTAKLWLGWAITAAVCVLLGLLALILWTRYR